LSRLAPHRLIGFVVAFAALVAFMPSDAHAHQGHHPAPTPAVQAHQDQSHAVVAIRAVVEEETHAQAAAVVQRNSDGGTCSTGCCTGIGCCGATLAANGLLLPLPLPPGNPSPFPTRAVAAFVPDSLLEPPNSLN